MQKIFLVIIILGCLITALAQTGMTLQKTIDGKVHKLDKNSVVKDSTGKQLSFDEWSSKIMSGNYDLVASAAKNENTIQEYFLKELSEEQKKINEQKNKVAKEKRAVNPIIAGSPVADFQIKDINGKIFSNHDLKGKVILFNFWYINCKPCVAEIPELNKIVERFRSENMVFIAPTKFDNKDAIKDFLKERKFTFNIIDAAESSKIPFIENVSAYPFYLLIDKDGVIRYYSTGYSGNIVDQISRMITQEFGN